MNKLRLYFKKYDNMRFVGHLDLLKTVQRAITRANIPAAYSQGFNPHQIVSFAMPLSLGYTGLSEIVEIDLESDIDENDCIKRLNSVFPKGLEIIRAETLKEGEKTAASLVEGAVYEIGFPEELWDKLGDAVNKILNATEILIEKESKHKINYVNIRGLINSISLIPENPGIIRISCAAGSVKTVRLDHILEEFYKFMGMDFSTYKYKNTYTRKELILASQK